MNGNFIFNDMLMIESTHTIIRAEEAPKTTPAANTPKAASPWGSLIMMGVILVAMFLLMILPQRRRDKKYREMLDTIHEGNRIRTVGGIYGTVVAVKKDTITIVSGPDDTKITFAKGAVAVVEPEDEPEDEDVENETETETEENE